MLMNANDAYSPFIRDNVPSILMLFRGILSNHLQLDVFCGASGDDS